MSYTIEDYLRETRQELLHSLTPEESKSWQKSFQLKQCLKAFPIDEVEKCLTKAISRNKYTGSRCLSLSKAIVANAFDKLRHRYNLFWKSPKIKQKQ